MHTDIDVVGMTRLSRGVIVCLKNDFGIQDETMGSEVSKTHGFVNEVAKLNGVVANVTKLGEIAAGCVIHFCEMFLKLWFSVTF